MSKKIIRNLILLIIFFIIQYIFSSFPVFFADEHENLLQGMFFEKIYSTVFLNHMPLSPLLVKISSLLINKEIDLNGLRILNTLINSLILFLIYKISLLISNKKFTSLLGPLLYLLWENTFWAKLYLTENPSSLFGIASLYVLLVGIQNKVFLQNKKELIIWGIIGFFIGLGTTSRFNLTYLAPFLFITYVILYKINDRKIDKVQIIKLLFIYILSYSIPIISFAIYFQLKGNLNDFIRYAFLFNLEQNKTGIVLSKFIPIVGSKTFYFLIGTLGLFLITLHKDKNIKNHILIFIYTAFTWLGCNPTGLGEVPFHAIPGLAGLCILNVITAHNIVKTKNKTFQKIILIIFITFLSICVYKNIGELIKYQKITFKDEQNSELFKENNRIAQIINDKTNSNQTIYLIGHNPYIYWKSKRIQSFNNDLLFNNDPEEIISKIETTKPDIIYFPGANNEFHYWNIINNQKYQKIFQYLIENYRFSNEDPQILERKNQFNKNNFILIPNIKSKNQRIKKEINLNQWTNYTTNSNENSIVANGNWNEIHQEVNIKIDQPNSSILQINLNCQNLEKNGNIRILFDGIGSTQHTNYWYTYTNINSINNQFEIPLNNFSIGNGEKQWNNITNIAVGGNEGKFKCQIVKFGITTYEFIF